MTYLLRPDALSVWFMAIIALVFTSGAIYGADYLKHYSSHKRELALHYASYILCFLSMIALTVIGNAIAFLVVWEIMALTSFTLIIFESWKSSVIKAGINFFIQSHIGVLFLTAGMLLYSQAAGSTYFTAWTAVPADQAALPFALICIGFAVKAGFVPFHTWLPLAHPAAPSHVSGVMSGVIIKIGIYGIFRMLTIANVNYLTAGYIILGAGAITGLYGVVLATLQENLKKLLAYSSIENIGIIGMGIGLGCIGRGLGSTALEVCGLGGALLHTLNHALFKSGLFFLAGNVLQGTKTLNINLLGGLAKRLPVTAALFTLGAVAICGLPPMNGFVSEWLIYTGLFHYLHSSSVPEVISAAVAIIALALIGGIAIIAFTKATSGVFLGSARSEYTANATEEFKTSRNFPIMFHVALMFAIGLCPQAIARLMNPALESLCGLQLEIAPALGGISKAALTFVIIALAISIAKRLATRGREIETGATWGCGYTAPTPKIQYTGASFVKTFANLTSGLTGFRKTKEEITELYPSERIHRSDVNYDKLEYHFIENPIKWYMKFTSLFGFLENGKIQSYILYGIIFILTICILTFVLC